MEPEIRNDQQINPFISEQKKNLIAKIMLMSEWQIEQTHHFVDAFDMEIKK